jgi:hypothetical protein
MALSEFELKRAEKITQAFVDKIRPPPHVRPQLDIGFKVKNQSVEIFEIRPVWDNPQETMEHPVARTTWVKSRKAWKVFWMRADLKWHAYPPAPAVKTLEQFLSLVEEDEQHCFWG